METTPTPQGRLSALTERILHAPIDLNRIAEAARAQQENGGARSDNERIYVDSEGQLLMGADADGTPKDRLSEVTHETFFSTRLADERAFVAARMPAGTQYITNEDASGWLYSVTTEFADEYKLFMTYDEEDRVYQVYLVDPPLGGSVDPHGAHLYPDGQLCLTDGPGSSYPDMERTYAKAAMWTRGVSCYRRGLGFQFNRGQA